MEALGCKSPDVRLPKAHINGFSSNFMENLAQESKWRDGCECRQKVWTWWWASASASISRASALVDCLQCETPSTGGSKGSGVKLHTWLCQCLCVQSSSLQSWSTLYQLGNYLAPQHGHRHGCRQRGFGACLAGLASRDGSPLLHNHKFFFELCDAHMFCSSLWSLPRLARRSTEPSLICKEGRTVPSLKTGYGSFGKLPTSAAARDRPSMAEGGFMGAFRVPAGP